MRNVAAIDGFARPVAGLAEFRRVHGKIRMYCPLITKASLEITFTLSLIISVAFAAEGIHMETISNARPKTWASRVIRQQVPGL